MSKDTSLKIASIPFIKSFTFGLYWNIIDSVGTQGLLIVYHLIFRSFFGTQLHGKMGCILSIFYLILIVSNAGLDSSIAPFLELFSKNRRMMRAFLFSVILPQSIFVGICSLVIYQSTFFLASLPQAVSSEVTKPFLALIAAAFFFESMRKTARTFLQLIFYNRLTAFVEISGMAGTVLCIILVHKHLGTFSLEIGWLVLAVLSIIQLIALSGGLLHFYTTLPKGALSPVPVKRIAQTRLFAWANQSLRQLFSGNFLVPVCALRFGVEQASLMKVTTSISQWIMLIGQKAFGISGNALLAHLKARSAETQQTAFGYLSFIFNQTLYALFIFLFINGKKLALLQMDGSALINWSLLYFMLIINLVESFFILYEKWYILEERASHFFLFNLVSFGLLYALIPYTYSPTTIASLIVIMRASTLLALSIFSFYRWKIWPSLQPRLRTVVASVSASLIFFLFL